jgi:GxxExxY protein
VSGTLTQATLNRLNGIFFRVQCELGRFCSERQYSDLTEKLLKENRLLYKREFELSNFSGPKGNRVDFLVENKIIVDIKAKKFITKDDYFQMLRYLECANLELGMIVNFRSAYLKPKRVLNSKLK